MITFPTHQLTRTRFSHTGDLLWLVETVSHALNMFTRLCMAIALGHDIGHVPFGHDGERTVKKYLREDFTHGWMGVRLLKIYGFSINYWVAYGIENHSDGDLKLNKVIKYPRGRARERFCDLVAILDDVACACSDPFDIIREYSKSDNAQMRRIAKKARYLVKKVMKKMGIEAETMEEAHQKILAAFAQNIIENTRGQQGIFMSKKYFKLFKLMKRFVYQVFHSSPYIIELRAECTAKLEVVMEEVERIMADNEYQSVIKGQVDTFLGQVHHEEEDSLKQKVVDFICTRTDKEICNYHKQLKKAS
ncbi:MAG: HD domain-containing protein [Ignavibacteriales bacterium]